MRIGIDTRLINESGIGRYIKNLLIELQKIDSKNEYVIFLRNKDFDSLTFPSNFKKVEADFAWYGIAEQVKFPPLIYSQKIDLMHFPHFNIPIFYHGKFIVTIHDLIHKHHSMSHATTHGPMVFAIKKMGYTKAFQTALEKSQKILVPSQFVKDQIIKEWKTKTEKITVTPEGVEENLLKVASNISKEEIQKVLKKYYVTKPFLFYAGNAHPHKNIDRLITSFFDLQKKYAGLQLVLSGRENFFWKKILKKIQDDKLKNIIHTGFIPDEELIAFYSSAKAYIFPSLEEGFGIPILEAMAAGAPVISSNAGSLKEVGGDAALYFNPNNVADMTEKISMVLSDQKLRNELIEKGYKRYRQFSWKKMVEQTLKIYEAV